MTSRRFFDWTRRQYERHPLVFHVPAWLFYILLPVLMLSLPQFLSRYELLKLFGIKFINECLCIGFFYLNYYVLTPEALRQRHPYRLVRSVVGMFVLLTVINLLYFQWVLRDDMAHLTAKLAQLPDSFMIPGSRLELPFTLVITSLTSFAFLLALSSGFAIHQDRQRQEARHQQVLLEKKEAELSALKLQISPHFLFNTLNNLRYLARHQSTQTEDAIERLAHMLRYMIYQTDQGPVPLEKEIDYLTDYLALQQLRLASHHRVIFEPTIDDDGVRIEPLLLIPFVENAFKHGIHHQEPSTVHIRIQVEQGHLVFWIKNRCFSASKSMKQPDSGIGITNVQRRLALHYPNRHRLLIEQQDDWFTVQLTLDLMSVPYEVSQHRH